MKFSNPILDQNLGLFDENSAGATEEMSHEFGGTWTKEKLSKLEQYLKQFTLVFKNQTWVKTIYIDAYAGTGTCTINTDKGQFTIAGSAKLALCTDPMFQEVIFIEQDKKRFEHLRKLKSEYPEKKIQIFQGDCNQILPDILINKLSKNHRGVIFVDPYGMNISWGTLKLIAASKKLDVWYLFPLSGLYRQAAINRDDITADKEASIKNLLGEDADWESLYKKSSIIDLFGDEKISLKRDSNIDQIVSFITDRLKSIFPYVSDPLILPSKGIRKFAFYFAISNDSSRAKDIAKSISAHILKSQG
eukprot:GDKJ01053849.1.p1 GENE.GDKJ01053849.1~~GDKJ01053849.1.p1  ORF type:complete len:304 (+),score=21.66 GDKJ01053849.1:399-1310(+)